MSSEANIPGEVAMSAERATASRRATTPGGSAMSAANTGATNTEAGRRARTPGANVERELVAAAEAVLVRDGPGGVTVRAVAAEAGIAPMGVYNRLGGKEGLVDALLIMGFDRLRDTVELGLDPAAGPDMTARFYACGLRYREFALGNPHFY